MEPEEIAVERYKAEQMFRSAAGWFWWIGALSLLNSAITMSGKQFTFTFGLGVAQIGDAWMAGESGILSTVGFFLSFGSSSLFLLLAWLSRHTTVAMPIGVAVYAADTLLFLLARDWLGLGFHVFALFLIVSGWRAYRRAIAALPQSAATLGQVSAESPARPDLAPQPPSTVPPSSQVQ
jgi:hypothetical protein